MPSSAQSQGMIGGSVGLANDPSIVRLNPASMLDVDGRRFQVSPSFLFGRTDFRSTSGEAHDMKHKLLLSGASNMVWKNPESPFAFGLGLNAPFGLAASWPREGPLKYQIPYEEELIYASLNPAIAYRFNKNISLGIGLEIAYSRLTADQDYPWNAVTGVPGTPDGDLTFQGDGWGFGAYAGINIQIAEGHRLSFVGRLPVSIDYDGDFDIDYVPGPLTGTFTNQSDFSSEIEFPASISAAYRLDLRDDLRVSIQYEWIQNSSHDDIPLLIGDNQPLLPSDRIYLDWDDSFSIGAGIEWDASACLTLRAGYLYSESPMGDFTFTPAIPADNRHLFSVGGTYQFNPSQSISLAYIAAFFEDRDVGANQNPVFEGEYNVHWDVLTLSYSMTW